MTLQLLRAVVMCCGTVFVVYKLTADVGTYLFLGH